MELEHEYQGQPSEASKEPTRVSAEWLMTGPPFDGGDGFRPGTTAADLIALLFEAPNRDDKVTTNSETFLEEVLLNLADDASLIECAAHNGDGMLTDVIARVANRMEYRVRVALEVGRRMRAAELASEQTADASAEPWQNTESEA